MIALGLMPASAASRTGYLRRMQSRVAGPPRVFVRWLRFGRAGTRVLALIIAVLFFAPGEDGVAQGRYARLRRWEGKYPTYNKSPRKFFDQPEINRPLRRLLNRRDYYLLTKGHTREMPISLVGSYLKVRVCGSPGSYACDNHTVLIFDLNDGSVYVAFDVISGPRYFSTKDVFTDLPEDVQSWFGPKAGTN